MLTGLSAWLCVILQYVSNPLSNRRIRIGIVGCGRIAQKHLGAIKANEADCELVALCDHDQAAMDAMDADESVARFESLDKMLEAGQLDLVSICTPSGVHARQTIQCAQAGIPVMTEKPMATRWQDGLDMVRACDDAGVDLFVVKQNRRNATLQLLKRAIEGGRFGRIHLVALNVFWTRPQEYYDTAAWRGTWEYDGGALMNQASHYVDLLDWMIGPVERVSAFTETRARDIEVEDTAVVNVRWRSGALGTVATTMCTYPKNLEGSITVLGETGTVRIGGGAVNEIQEWNFADEHPDDQLIAESNYETTSVYGHGHPPFYQNVIQTLRGEETALTDGREGLKSLELLIACYRSARNGKPEALPLSY